MLKRILIGLSVVLLLGVIAVVAFLRWQGQAASDPAFFESAIVAFEEADALGMPPPGGIVFVGSSSIRFWDSLAEDMAPLPVIRRGFGGAHMTHVIHNAHRVIVPYAPRAVVVFVGGNDLSSGKSAERVVDDFKSLLRLMHEELPVTDIWLLSMKPSKLRWDQWDEMKQVSAALEAISESDPRIRFVDTGSSLLGRDGSPDDVYIFDGLHLNAEGYRRWTQVLKQQLLEAYGEG